MCLYLIGKVSEGPAGKQAGDHHEPVCSVLLRSVLGGLATGLLCTSQSVRLGPGYKYCLVFGKSLICSTWSAREALVCPSVLFIS